MNRLAHPGQAGRPQSRGEEIANAVSHAAALIAAIGAGPWLISWGRSRGVEGFAGVCVFVATMVWLYLASTVYHALPEGRAKQIFLKLDHGAVYLFIAGSYTAFAAGHLGDPWGGAVLALVWLVAAAGMALKAMGRLASPWLSTGGYLAMGWLVLLAAVPILERASPAGAQWLVAGGCAYTVGVVFFVLDARIRYAHAVWHGFVAAGTACHTWAVLG
ncbi:hemolysin III family protein [Acidovorax sp. JG5]|uniref:PAQR family membrane homeostasis protein TrhA n=1 Tax=Acidovorax sp. JG5 TaxID=2822718 RepID=UPI001B333602|nr:hemolysin III family protein [Acidovorax sp. JG5]MBP3979576.1 hemolysin III family protein [Acidovorax sp. JG5]